MRVVAQLSMEYHRFLAWARVSGVLQGSLEPKPAVLPTQPTYSQFSFSDDLVAQLGAPIENAAARIVTVLGEVAEIAEKYSKGRPSSGDPARPSSVTAGLSTVLPIFGARHSTTVTSLTVRHRMSAATFQENTSFRQRFLFTSKPWGQADQKALTSKVKELSYWNDRLERLLPSAVQQSLSTQALPGQVLIDENRNLLETLVKAAEHRNEAVKTHAKLWKERLDFLSTNLNSYNAIQKYRQSKSVLRPEAASIASRCELSIANFSQGQGGALQ